MASAEEMRDLTLDVRRNTDELGAAIRDLNAWEKQMNAKDEQLIAAHLESKSKPNRLQSSEQKYASFDVNDALSMQSTIKSDAKEEAASLKEQGNAFFQKGKYSEAVKAYSKAIDLDPTNPVFFANRAMANIKLENYEAAEPDCSVALGLDESYIKALQRRALSREKLDKYRLALEDCRRVLQLEPNNAQVLAQLQRIEKRKQGSNTTRKTSKSSTTNSSLKENLTGAFGNKDEGGNAGELEPGQVLPIYKEPSQRSNKPLVRIQIEDLQSAA